ncbi:MAG: anhydro-N-acetylmuramic acid kinase [Fimbriimonadaceae bacterium]
MTILGDLGAQAVRRVAGVISGTSMDGIDVAVCSIVGAGFEATVGLERFASVPYDTALAARLRAAPDFKAQDVAELNILVGEAFATAVKSVGEGLSVELVGSHGQTIYHHSSVPGSLRASLQVGDGDILASRLGIPVVSDFRSGDIAAGGEGAPLTPYADFVLFGSLPGRAVLNLGGIANLTILGDRLADVTGFDTGPANAPLDRIARAEFGIPFDRDGLHARSGSYDANLLNRLLDEDAFVSAIPPKSTGFEAYGDAFVAMLRARCGVGGANLLRLATEYVVESVARQIPMATSELILSGGGAENAFVRERLGSRIAPHSVRLSDEFGVPARAREAMAFAILANDAVCGLPTSLPRVTGAAMARRLGKLSFP